MSQNKPFLEQCEDCPNATCLFEFLNTPLDVGGFYFAGKPDLSNSFSFSGDPSSQGFLWPKRRSPNIKWESVDWSHGNDVGGIHDSPRYIASPDEKKLRLPDIKKWRNPKMAKAYQYDASGYYVGETDDYGGPLPNNATPTAPLEQEGHVPHWNGKKWENRENHKGEEGYLDGESHTVKDYGPLPDGWSETAPEPTEAEQCAARIAEIKTELQAIDTAKIRPMSALIEGIATQEDKIIHTELKTKTDDLRAEMQMLEAFI